MNNLTGFAAPAGGFPIGNFVYRIVNRESGKAYIGSTGNLTRRFTLHKTDLVNGKHHNAPLQKDWDLVGIENFAFEILEQVEKGEMPVREQYWINRHGCARSLSCYNKRDVIPVSNWPEGWFEETLETAAAIFCS
jgi:group I intron endonuclease